MKKLFVLISAIGFAWAVQAEGNAPWMVAPAKIVETPQATCPSFPGVMWNSLIYNLGCIPWDLEFYDGAEVAATYTWYRYPQGGSQASATPCDWQTDFSTYRGFKPATDEMGTYIYFCQATASGCSTVKSGEFTVQIGANGDPCYNIQGKTFSVIQGSGSYVSGQEIVIQANNNADGGMHQYTWYHNGVEIDLTDPHYTVCADDEQCWHNPNLTIHNATPDDGGTYSVMMQDGTECFMYTDPIRILVDNPSCGPVPTLAVEQSAICEGERTRTGVGSNTLASGEEGRLEYMVQPEGSHPTTTAPGIWTTDMPGLYQFKYVVENPGNASCFRESKVVSIRVYENGGTLTITPDAEVIKSNSGTVSFTVSPAPGADEKASVSFTSDGGQSGTVYPNTYPNFKHTCYSPGTYTYTYTLTNTKAGCSRTATCKVMWYSCGWVTARFNNYVSDKIKLGNSINLGPAVPTETGMIGILTVSKDGGIPEEIPTSSPYTPTEPGTYEFHYEVKHSDSRVTECYSETSKTIVVEPCGTAAQLSTNKTVLKVGETATLTYNSPASGETMKLTYTKDGGSAQPAATTPSPYTFAPTEAGEYVFTYSITNSGCGTNSQSVTIEVYDCGPEASIIASQTMVKPNTPITLTLSDVGADETATLTVSKDGGAEQPITISASPLAFTPAEEGTYTFTYTITHAYINCSRSARAEVQVIDCDPDVTISTDKTIVAVGEGVGILLSRTANSRETATLTYRKDGGAAQTLASNLSPLAFTPTAAGTYELTYTLTDDILGCVTTDKTTFTVYECGPEAIVTASRTTVRTEDVITISVSTPGANETGTLTVSRNGGSPQTITAGSWSASEEGTYTFIYTITHAYIDCTRSDQVVVGVSNCGEPVQLLSDKTIYTLGETVTFSLSRTANADETPSLNISKDGGAAQPIAISPSPITFTPTETGTYTAIYSLNNAVLGCETNGEVTFRVYECGPEASVMSDKTVLKVGESAQLTLSDPGADETATLTYSKDNGAAQPIAISPSPLAFSPTEAGTYVITYAITHAYISCSRNAQVTIKVYDCGVPAAISSDKAALKLGEAASLTLSAVSADETATLTYSKDGGAAQTLASNLSPLAFTPDAVGEYVFTYTVKHNVIDCETSAQVTVKVYECGPASTISLSTTEQKLLRPVTITLSDPGTDETASLTVSINGGAPSPVTGNPSPFTFTPNELGVYTFTYTITHPYIDCARSATATLNVEEAELVFDDKNGTHLWSDAKNWWPAYNRIPNAGDSVVIRQSCQVDIDNAVTKDLTIDMTSGTALTIQPAGALLVINHLMQAKKGQILVQADANHNGALVVGPDNTDLPADVVFFARSENKEEFYPVWQYMGSPVQESLNIDQSYQGAVFYEWTNTPNRQRGGNWQRIDSLSGSLMPFTGYCMTQTNQKTYTLQGTLNNPVRKEIALPHNDRGPYPDFAFVANSWVAPIDISQMDVADFGAADATVYIMNTGTYEEAIQQQADASAAGTGAARGQYNTIPVHAASYVAGGLTVIPPMQGFFVHTRQATTMALDYTKAVFTPALSKVSTTPTRAPQAHNPSPVTHNPSVLRLHVEGYGAEDEVYLLTDPSFTEAFDNGWDGYKARSDMSPVSLAVLSDDGPLAVAALPEWENTELSFDGGNHKTYTITITNNQSTITNNLYLLDKESGVYTGLTDGATYTFQCGAATRRLVIIQKDELEKDMTEKEKPFKYIENGLLYIRVGERLYNGNGELLKQ